MAQVDYVISDEAGSLDACAQLVTKSLKSGRHCVLDRCNASDKERKLICRVASAAAPTVRIDVIFFATPPELCLVRAKRRPAHPTLAVDDAEKVIGYFAHSFRYPTPSEARYHAIHVCVVDDAQIAEEMTSDAASTVTSWGRGRRAAAGKHSGERSARASGPPEATSPARVAGDVAATEPPTDFHDDDETARDCCEAPDGTRKMINLPLWKDHVRALIALYRDVLLMTGRNALVLASSNRKSATTCDSSSAVQRTMRQYSDPKAAVSLITELAGGDDGRPLRQAAHYYPPRLTAVTFDNEDVNDDALGEPDRGAAAPPSAPAVAITRSVALVFAPLHWLSRRLTGVVPGDDDK